MMDQIRKGLDSGNELYRGWAFNTLYLLIEKHRHGEASSEILPGIELGQIELVDFKRRLQKLATSSPDPSTRSSAFNLLGKFADPAMKSFLRTRLRKELEREWNQGGKGKKQEAETLLFQIMCALSYIGEAVFSEDTNCMFDGDMIRRDAANYLRRERPKNRSVEE